ncbi:MAG: hypothetical protein GDA45_04565 [Chromatiales bacterium]|nr:hypothetical protein [Chromatiales bacterium]
MTATPKNLTHKKKKCREASDRVSHENFPGLAGMIFACYAYEQMLTELREEMITEEKTAKETDDSYETHLARHHAYLDLDNRHQALLRAWVCVFFEILRVIVSDEYKKAKSSFLEGKNNKLDKMKKRFAYFRSHLSKLKENKALQKGVDKESLKGKIKMSPYEFYTLDYNVPIPLGGHAWTRNRSLHIKDEFNEFLSILLED